MRPLTATLTVLLGACLGCGILPELGGTQTCAELAAPNTAFYAQHKGRWTLDCEGEPERAGTFAVGAVSHTETMPCQGADPKTCVPCDPSWGLSCSHAAPGLVAPLREMSGPGLVAGGSHNLCGGMGGGSVSLVFERSSGARIRCEVPLLGGEADCYQLEQDWVLDGKIDDCRFTGALEPTVGSGGAPG